MLCIVCKTELIRKQTKFCSHKCKCQFHNSSTQTYKKQRDKGISRKLEFVNRLGRKCSICGYNKNLAVFNFHHIDPSTKKFNLDIHALGNRSYESCIDEVNKCSLLCSNCHGEIHNKSLDLDLLC